MNKPSVVLFAIAVLSLLARAAVAAPLISIQPSLLYTESETFSIKWSGVHSASVTDYIALFDYPTPVNRLPWAIYNNTNGASSGALTVDLLNWRVGYQFVYFQATSSGSFLPLAVSNPVIVNKMYPTQVHLALTEQPSSMRVMWVTGGHLGSVVYGYKPDLSDGVLVRFHINFISYLFLMSCPFEKVSSRSQTYSVNQMCGLNAAIYYLDPGYIHSAIMTNLRPSTVVYYRAQHSTNIASKIMSFTTPPTTGAENSITMFAFGDSGVSKCQNQTGWCEPDAGNTYANIQSDMAANPQFSLLLHIGDISYAVGHANRWEQFFHEIKPMATKMPYVRSIFF